ncbi:MAG: protein kinase, partial [Betaproteobacteria bacterium]|nr:protein kinase [Betaproteobacteria bacterium]
MSFLSSLFGSSNKIFTPFESEYFTSRAAHAQALQEKVSRGSAVGREIVEEFEGGMAKVVIGRNEDGLAAIKSLKTGNFDIADADRLADEAAKLIGLDLLIHLVPDDISREPGKDRCVIVLPYCAGGSLEDRAAAGRLEFDEVVYYGFVLAAELARLHEVGILHLDLKPANVLLHKATKENNFYRWRPVISDYGLSLYRRPGKPVPSAGGTPFFMSPEQCLGMPVEAPTDVWGYAATLYYLATKRSPLASVWPLSTAGSEKRVKPLIEFRSDCPPWFSNLVAHCLELNPKRRPGSFRKLLTEYLRQVR